MPVKPKPHRLAKEAYRGQIRVAFTACVRDRRVLFDGREVADVFLSALGEGLQRFACSAPVYCFMPDHLHVIVQGEADTSDARGAMAAFKQKTGFWLRRHRPDVDWQKDFWDHILRSDEDLGAQVRYIADNPVRRGLVADWRDYPFTGSIGHDLREILLDAGSLVRM